MAGAGRAGWGAATGRTGGCGLRRLRGAGARLRGRRAGLYQAQGTRLRRGVAARGSAAAVIVYDITKQDSFHTLKKWVKELKEHGPENIVMAIAGNKCDLSDIREVPLKDAKEYAESIGAVVVETSAKNAINIEELFQGISRQIPPLDPHENGNSGSIKLGKPTSQVGRRCC